MTLLAFLLGLLLGSALVFAWWIPARIERRAHEIADAWDHRRDFIGSIRNGGGGR